MAASNSSLDTISGLFKRVYGDLTDLLPSGYAFQEMLGKCKISDGESVQEAVQLSHENGVTLAGFDGSEVSFEDSQSGVIKQAQIKSYEIFLQSSLATNAIAKAAKGGDQAFEAATKNRVAANVKSHMRFREQTALYGQDVNGVGRVSFFSGDFRGITFTDGAGTIAGVTLATGGIDAAGKVIGLDPADIASGLWIGAEGMEVEEVETSGNTVVASGKVTKVDTRNGLITVDFTPIASTSDGSHVLKLKLQRTNGDMVGAKKILTNSGSLFGIDASVYGLWAGTNIAVTGKLTFAKLTNALEEMCDYGLDRDVEIHIPFETWSTLLDDQAALRSIDSSYSPEKVQGGHKAIEFYFNNGMVKVVPNRFVRRGDAFVFAKDDWCFIGAADPGLKVPGSDDGDLILQPINSNVYKYRSYSSSSVFCYAPRRSAVLTNIDPESAT